MELNIDQIKEVIPHRYPFLLVDKILEAEPGVKAVGVKNVTMAEPWFQGHFPDFPIMPGVLIVEALAQTSGIALALLDEYKGMLGVFAGIEEMKFKKQVRPGDVLQLETEIMSVKMNIAKANVKASVEGNTAAKGIISFAMIKR
ncbi:MAG: 3-hydroxyacyl-ACP dehydratase FabZ [Clostridiales bacterium]|jgi:3-hydroxyacyl-[acyl-carrier-protein] dehydratase|nr:3-hydroxyacyl-ACP dehydratase FabZ [Clostridiales bacterium]